MAKRRLTLADLESLATPAPEESITPDVIDSVPGHPGDGTNAWVVTRSEYELIPVEGVEHTYKQLPIFKVVAVASAKKLWDYFRGNYWIFKGISAMDPYYGVFNSEADAVSCMEKLNPHEYATTEYRPPIPDGDFSPNYGWMDRDRPW